MMFCPTDYYIVSNIGISAYTSVILNIFDYQLSGDSCDIHVTVSHSHMLIYHILSSGLAPSCAMLCVECCCLITHHAALYNNMKHSLKFEGAVFMGTYKLQLGP